MNSTDHSGDVTLAEPLRRAATWMRWGLASLLVIYGVATEDWASTAWSAIAVLVFGGPLVLQFSPWPVLRSYALWLGLFVAAQSFFTHALRADRVTLTPNMQRTVDVRTHEIPGYAPGKRQVSTDERGYRVTPPLDYRNHKGTRIFAIGGSTTADIPLDDRATWTHRLQAQLSSQEAGLRVVNTGVAGLRAVNHLATLKDVVQLDPSLVLVLLGANDWNKQIKDQFEPRRGKWHPPALRYTVLGVAIDGLIMSPLRKKVTGRSWADTTLIVDSPTALTQDGAKLGFQRTIKQVFRPNEVDPSFAADLRRIGALCTQAKLRCVFITQPHVYRDGLAPDLKDLLWMTPPYANYTLDLESMAHIAALYNAHLKEFAAQGGHRLCDVASSMPAERRFFYDDIHFTDDGAQRVAELLLPCVKSALTSK